MEPNELNKIARLNSNDSKRRKPNELWKTDKTGRTQKVIIKEEFIGDEMIGNVFDERDKIRMSLTEIKSSVTFFLGNNGIDINVLDPIKLSKALSNLCVINDIKKDIPKYVHNDFHIIDRGKLVVDKKKKYEHLKNVKKRSGELL